MELVTGRAGSPHITSQQDRQKHQGIWGTGAYILNTGNNLEAVVQSSNNIQIKDGALMSQGALFSVKVGTVDEVTIANGSQGMMRKDVIVARYTYNQGTNTENAEWAVVQGTPAASNPQIPQITEGDIQAGDATVDTSVFIVTLDGINITSVDVVPELAPDIAELKALIDELNGKMKADDDWRTYSDNGWEMQYRHISQNQVYVEVKKTSTGNNAAIVGDLVMAGVPFAASFGQIVPVYMDVSGSIVGYGRANFATNNGLYLYTPAYGNSVSYTVFGIVTVE